MSHTHCSCILQQITKNSGESVVTVYGGELIAKAADKNIESPGAAKDSPSFSVMDVES